MFFSVPLLIDELQVVPRNMTVERRIDWFWYNLRHVFVNLISQIKLFWKFSQNIISLSKYCLFFEHTRLQLFQRSKTELPCFVGHPILQYDVYCHISVIYNDKYTSNNVNFLVNSKKIIINVFLYCSVLDGRFIFEQ